MEEFLNIERYIKIAEDRANESHKYKTELCLDIDYIETLEGSRI